MASAAFLGVLEEYRFYVRAETAETGTPGDPAAELVPRLSRARVFPGTEVAYDGVNNLRADLADHVWDLQVALAFDLDGNGAIAASDDDDEWLYNSADDDPLAPEWSAADRLHYVQLTTLGLSQRRDRGYRAPLIGALEDHSYTHPLHPLNERAEARMFRHRVLRTLVDLRNL